MEACRGHTVLCRRLCEEQYCFASTRCCSVDDVIEIRGGGDKSMKRGGCIVAPLSNICLVELVKYDTHCLLANLIQISIKSCMIGIARASQFSHLTTVCSDNIALEM